MRAWFGAIEFRLPLPRGNCGSRFQNRGACCRRTTPKLVFPSMSLFEDEFRAFALAEERNPLPRDPVLFYGSSSIRLWETLALDFPGLPVVNRAFGGSTLRECVAAME